MTTCSDVGLDFNVGVGGRRLTMAQRQKLDVARALAQASRFPHPQPADVALDQRLQDQILSNVLEEAKRDGRKPAIIWVLSNPHMAKHFDRVIVFDARPTGRRRNARYTVDKETAFSKDLCRSIGLVGN